MTDHDLIHVLVDLTRRGQRAALATVTHVRGHVPREIGAKMLVLPDGRTYGTIGGGCGEGEVRLRALDVLDTGEPVLHVVDLMDDPALEDSAVCGGKMEVFIEAVPDGMPPGPGSQGGGSDRERG